MSCATIYVQYISKSPSETLTPAVFLSDLSPPSHTHTDSRVHEKCWLVRLSLSLHPTTYSLSFSLSASFSCSVYLSSTTQFPQKMVKWSYKNDILYKIKLNDNIPQIRTVQAFASEPQMRIIQRHYIIVAEDIRKSGFISQNIVCFIVLL